MMDTLSTSGRTSACFRSWKYTSPGESPSTRGTTIASRGNHSCPMRLMSAWSSTRENADFRIHELLISRPRPGSADARPIQTPESGEVEPVEVHDLVPGAHEVANELLLRVVGRVDLGDGTQFGVRTEDQ